MTVETDSLRDELAQAIGQRVSGWCFEEGDGFDYPQVREAADAVQVLVEQRIAEAAAVGEDAMQTAYELGVKNERERIAARIEALPSWETVGIGRVVVHRDALRVVRGDE